MMDQMKFLVDVEKATPACSADCPNLKIDIVELCGATDYYEGLRMFRRFRCVNDDYCRRLYRAFEEKGATKND